VCAVKGHPYLQTGTANSKNFNCQICIFVARSRNPGPQLVVFQTYSILKFKFIIPSKTNLNQSVKDVFVILAFLFFLSSRFGTFIGTVLVLLGAMDFWSIFEFWLFAIFGNPVLNFDIS
jgi:hypothetical protein